MTHHQCQLGVRDITSRVRSEEHAANPGRSVSKPAPVSPFAPRSSVSSALSVSNASNTCGTPVSDNNKQMGADRAAVPSAGRRRWYDDSFD